MAKKSKIKSVETLTHEEATRKNIPTAEHQSIIQERIETISDAADLQEVYDTERHLLYVACTRARDYLLVTSGDMPSEFLDDLRAHQ